MIINQNTIIMNKIIIACATLCCAFCLSVCGYTWMNQPKTAYVNLTKLYDSFKLKTELENNLISLKTDTQYLLDSLASEMIIINNAVKVSSNSREKEELVKLEREYLLKQSRINEDYQNLLNRYDDQIWNQLNQYVDDFSKNEGYAYLIGSKGTGTIMGGNAQFDITTKLITYANARYSGAN